MPGAPHTWAGRPRDGPEGGGEVAGAPAGDTGMCQGTHPLLLVWLILVDSGGFVADGTATANLGWCSCC